MITLHPRERVATVVFKSIDGVTPHEVLTTQGRVFDIDIARDGSLYGHVSGGGFVVDKAPDDDSVIVLAGQSDRTPVRTIAHDEAVRLLTPVREIPYHWCEGCNAAIPLAETCPCVDTESAE